MVEESVAGEGAVDELFDVPVQLALAEAVEFDSDRASGEAVLDGREAQQIRRTSGGFSGQKWWIIGYLVVEYHQLSPWMDPHVRGLVGVRA